MAAVDISKLDLYKIIGVDEDASEKQIIKSYRKKALACHPDKNPDNASAVEVFLQLSKALEVLTDVAARAAYDNILKAKKATELRQKQYDSKRKKFKDDLDAREAAAEEQKSKDLAAKRNLKEEIERLRKEGSKLLEQEQEYLREQLKKEKQAPTQEEDDSTDDLLPRLKVKWKAKKDDDTNGGYSYDKLMEIFSRYGEVTALVVSPKKKGSAIVEFKSYHAALQAVQQEIGYGDNPLRLTWIGKGPNPSNSQTDRQTNTVDYQGQMPQQPPSAQTPNSMVDNDFESLVLMRMRQAEERKRLIQQMQQEDNAT